MTPRLDAIRSPQLQQDPYEALGAVIGTALANLFSQLAGDIEQAVDRAMASIPPAEIAADTKATLSVKEAARRLDVGLNHYPATHRGWTKLESVWIGDGRRVIPTEALTEYVNRLRSQVPLPSPATSRRRPAGASPDQASAAKHR